MAEAASSSMATIDWMDIIIITDIAIVICIVEEPVDAAKCVGADSFGWAFDSNSKVVVSPNEGQPKEVFDEFLAKLVALEPEFAEPNQRRSRGYVGGAVALVVALVVALAVGESFEEAPEGVANSTKRAQWIPTIGGAVASWARVNVEHSALERVPTSDQEVEHVGGNARRDEQFAEAKVGRNR